MAFWDARYSEPGFAYGIDPNAFLAGVVERLPRGRALCLGEGEGRNGVFLAEKGFEVEAVDLSTVGLEKAQGLAAERGVELKTTVADLSSYAIDEGAWDVIVSIFCHLPPDARRRLHRQIAGGLKEGGALVLEAYTPAQLGRGTGGPPVAEMMVSLAELREDLADLDLARAAELERDVFEGRYHKGTSAVVQVLGFKR